MHVTTHAQDWGSYIIHFSLAGSCNVLVSSWVHYHHSAQDPASRQRTQSQQHTREWHLPAHKVEGGQEIVSGINSSNSSHGWNSMLECRSQAPAWSLVSLLPFYSELWRPAAFKFYCCSSECSYDQLKYTITFLVLAVICESPVENSHLYTAAQWEARETWQ